ncbi:MAG TPA: hypothetical protein VN805_02230 [Caulobacteraceae bacterium]|nr:hypothetical protein [Caulobacteraceae bacterium]
MTPPDDSASLGAAKAEPAQRAVALPAFELFQDQNRAYRDELLPPAVAARVTAEAAAAMRSFGTSAPGKMR